MKLRKGGRATLIPTDEDLIAATLEGDRSAYRIIVERYQPRLLRMVFDLLKNQADAEDIVQESFVKAFLSLDKFKGDSSFFTWLYRITFNLAVDFQRKAQRRGGTHFEYKEQIDVSKRDRDEGVMAGELPMAPLSQSVEGPHEALLRKETAQKLEQVFATLSDEHRLVMALREIDGLDYEEIARILGVPRGTVMSRLFYARRALQRALEEFKPDSLLSIGSGELEGDQMDTTNASHEPQIKQVI